MIRSLLTVLLIFSCSNLFAADIFVDQSAAPNGNGTSWATAFRDIQSAIDAASANDVIFIAEGTYQPESEIDITIPLTIRGGYPQGGGTQNIPAHIAQIQADFDVSNLIFRVFDIAANAETSMEGLRFYNARVAINTRSNLTLNDIQFYGSTIDDVDAAGTFDNLIINNCLFSNNSGTSLDIGSSIINTITVTSSIFQNGTSRVISANDDANIFNISNCIIKDYVSTGTLVSIDSANTTLTDVTVTNNNANVFSFDENTTTINGMVARNNIESRLIYHREGTLNIINSTFTENNGDNAVCIQSSNAVLLNVENSTFNNNSSTDGGVAVLRSNRSNTNLINSKFNNNSSEGTFNNAVMDLTGNENFDILINIDGCEFKNNVSEGNAAVEIEYYFDLIINNCLFENNGTGDSEDLDLWYLDSAVITNNTFKNNTSNETVINIGYMYVNGALIENNVFLNNTAREINADRVQDYISRNNQYYGDIIKVDIGRSASAFIINDYFEGNSTDNDFIDIDRSQVTISNSTLISTKPTGTHTVIDSGNDTNLRILNSTISAQNYADTHVRVDFDNDLPSWVRNSIIWSGNDLTQSALSGGTSNLTVKYSLIKGEDPAGAGNIDGTNNANRPRFSDPSDLDFRHRLCSPTVNAGNNSYNSETLDILDNLRLFESTIDMGSYELQEPASGSCVALERPLCTALISPLDGDVNIALDTQLSWSPDPNATGYILRVGSALGSFDILNETLGNVTSYNLSDDLPEGSEIFVRIIPFNGAGNALSCVSESFNTESVAVISNPSCTNLTSPLDNTTNVSINSDISWTQDPNAGGYLITVGTTSGGTEILNNFDVGNETTYDFPFDLPEITEIFVTIISYNSVANATGCNEESFTTAAAPTVPDCAFIDNPDDGGNNVPVATNIFWNAIANADGYILTVGTTSGGNDIVDNEDVGDVVTYDFLTDLPENTEIFITIVPYNSVGNATGCLEESFTTETLVVTNPFITTWETTTANETITIPTRTPTYVYDYTIDWGDGTIDSNVTGDITHVFSTAGIKTIEITGIFPQIHFNGDAVDRDKILTIEQWGDIEWQALTQAFKGCSNLNITNPSIDTPNLSSVINVSEAFRDATTFNGDITAWDVSSVTNMLRLFNNASSFNQDIGNWDVSNAVTMTRLFEGATAFNQNIGNWNTANVTSMAVMFTNATNFNQDIGSWNVSNVTDMNTMFGIATSFNQDIGNWDVGNVINMNQMFYNASVFNQDLSAWDVSQVNGMIVMFLNATSFDQNIGGWNVTNVTNATSMFSGVTLSVANYEALLIGWNNQNLQLNVPFSGGNSTYCSQEAQNARANMIASDGWTITDGGLSASPTFDTFVNVTIADTYTLPVITGTDLTGNELYYTGANGTGTSYTAGDVIAYTDFPSYPITLYIFDDTACNTSEISFELTITESTIPNCTTLTSPLNGATNVSIATDLTWITIANADGYFLTVGTSSGGTDILDNFDVGNFTTYDLPTDLPEITEIFVTIIPYNGVGNATGCSEESFTTESITNTDAFITTWKTDNVGVSNDDQITIPTQGGGYNYTVNWGDGNTTTGETGDATHTYATIGTYTVTITGDFPRIHFNNDLDKDKILTIEQWGNNAWTSMESAFYGCTNLNTNNSNIDEPNLTNVTDLDLMFQGCSSFNGDITNWDVSTIETMRSLFREATVFNQDIGNWDVSNVQTLDRTFSSAIAFNQDISSWNVSNVTDMLFTFYNAESFNQPIQSWDVSNVTRFARTFEETEVFNQPIGVWNTSSATNISGAFSDAVAFNQDLSNWDVSNVTLFRNVFEGAISFNQDIGNWDTSSATDMLFMFRNATAFNQDIGNWNVSQVYRTFAMFENAIAFDQDLSAWNVESISTAERMFDGVTLSTANYDALLISWNAQDLLPNVIFSGGNSQYCLAEPDRTNMIDTDFWVITDGGNANSSNAVLDSVADVTSPNNYTLPVITGTGLTGNERYFTEPNGNGIEYNAGNIIQFADFPSYPITLYVFDTTICNSSEEQFLLTITLPTVPNCTTLTSPLNGATDISIATDVTWTAIANADGYFLTVGTTSGGNDILDNFDVGNNTTYDLPADLPETTEIFVTIIPYNGVGNATGCAEDSFTTETLANIPNCTILTSPLDGATDISINTDLTWTAATEADGYFITVGTSFGGNDILDNFDVGNTTTYDLALNLPETTEIYVTIVPYNGVGNAIGCTEESFTTETLQTLPGCTALTTPLNGATNVPVNTNLVWDAAPDATGYIIAIGILPGGSEILFNFNVGNVLTYNPPVDLPPNTDIFVRILPSNSFGNNPTGCVEESFRTGDALTLPNCTNLTSPLNTSNDIALDTDLSWNLVPSATGYFVTVGTTSGGNDILDNFDVGNVNTYDLPADLPENTEIFVSIIPYNGVGVAIGCTEESFTTETISVLPDCTNLNLPLNGSTDVSVSTDISWAPVSNANGYLLTVGTTSGGSDILNTFDIGNITTYDFPTNLPDNTTIYVSIIPYNSIGNASGCIEQSFTTETVASVPGCTILALPISGETNISVSTDISWMPISIADGYILNIGTTSGGTDILNNLDVGNITIYNLSNDLPANTEIFITVIPYNVIGNAIGCAEEIFTTEDTNIILECTTLTMPLAGSTNVSVVTNFTWDAVPGANGYLISIGTNTVLLDAADVGNALFYDMPFDLPENTEIIVQISPYLVPNDVLTCDSEWFTTGTAPIAPECTMLASPLNGATNVLSSVDLNWNAVTDADGYRLSIGTTSGGNDVLDNVDVGNVTTYDIPTDLPDNTEIFVILIPYNDAGDASGCTEESFTTLNTDVIPICTRLISPLDLATDVAVDTNLTWVTEPDATGYRLSVGTTTNGIDILDNFDVGNSTTFDLPSDLPENTQIFVNIVPYNTNGEPSDCLEESFTTGFNAELPECTTLVSPLNSSINVSITTDISWEPSGEATGYILNIGTLSGGIDVVDNVDVGDVTSYDFPLDLPENTEIFVTIIPYNAVGNSTLCSEESFMTGSSVELPETDTTKYGFSPDGDGINEFWKIDGIENYENTTVTIYNRWGDMVFQIKDYNNSTRVFRGEANKKTNMGAGKLPSGTYFFDIQINGDHNLKKTQGYVIIKR